LLECVFRENDVLPAVNRFDLRRQGGELAAALTSSGSQQFRGGSICFEVGPGGGPPVQLLPRDTHRGRNLPRSQNEVTRQYGQRGGVDRDPGFCGQRPPQFMTYVTFRQSKRNVEETLAADDGANRGAFGRKDNNVRVI